MKCKDHEHDYIPVVTGETTRHSSFIRSEMRVDKTIVMICTKCATVAPIPTEPETKIRKAA